MKIDKLKRNAKYIVHYHTNHNNKVVADNMFQNGFKNIYQMMDGMVGWNLNNLPVFK